MAKPEFAVRFGSKPRTLHGMALVRNCISASHGYLADVQHQGKNILSTILSTQALTRMFSHLDNSAHGKGFSLHNYVPHTLNSVRCTFALFSINKEKPFLLTVFFHRMCFGH